MTWSLRAACVGLLVWPALVWPQRPSEADEVAAFERSRQKALEYAKSLPDFVCTEVVHRLYDASQRGRFRAIDKLTIKLSYFAQREEHKLVLIDDKPTGRAYESLDGAIGVGEFGSMLHSIFDPASQASFRWERWKRERNRVAAVYSYVVPQAHSSYLIETRMGEKTVKAIVGYHGSVEIDRDTDAVLHFTYDADRIPKELQLQSAQSFVDYEPADVGGRDYLLPARSQTEMNSRQLMVRNRMEFTEYRKFSTESTINFGTAR